jgi:hypothetical protein
MIGRRQVIGGVLAGGVVGALAEPSHADAAGQSAAERLDVAAIARELEALRKQFGAERQFTEIASLREAQLTYLRGNSKLPDYIEVGTDLWFAAYDWHVRWQQPLTISRDPIGRMTLLLVTTQLVLRPDAQGNFMSLPYDQRG